MSATKSAASRYPSPLRYPGGKGKLTKFIELLIKFNELDNVTYVEPYAGGASVALSLLERGVVENIRINDLNPGVFAFWQSAISDSAQLCDRILTVPLTMEEWRRQRETYKDPSASQGDLGFATFYLNRTNRSGIIARGSVIGGLEQTGRWTIEARFNRESLCRRITSIAQNRDRIIVDNYDAVDLIRKLPKRGAARFFLYLDPPYYVKGAQLYDNAYSHEDHVRVRETLDQVKANWLTSYDAAPQIKEIYSRYRGIAYSFGYSASKVLRGEEVMYFSPKLAIPEGNLMRGALPGFQEIIPPVDIEFK